MFIAFASFIIFFTINIAFSNKLSSIIPSAKIYFILLAIYVFITITILYMNKMRYKNNNVKLTSSYDNKIHDLKNRINQSEINHVTLINSLNGRLRKLNEYLLNCSNNKPFIASNE